MIHETSILNNAPSLDDIRNAHPKNEDEGLVDPQETRKAKFDSFKEFIKWGCIKIVELAKLAFESLKKGFCSAKASFKGVSINFVEKLGNLNVNIFNGLTIGQRCDITVVHHHHYYSGTLQMVF